MVLPPIEPLDAVVELGKEARRRLGELLGDDADEPAVRRLPAHEDLGVDEGGVEGGRLLCYLQAVAMGVVIRQMLVCSTPARYICLQATTFHETK